MFDTTFSHVSSFTLDPSTPDPAVLTILHDFGAVIHLNPDCKSYQPTSTIPKNLPVPPNSSIYDCEDSLTFLPKKLWDGGVWYVAVFTPTPNGCDIMIKAPGGFTSTNHWRLSASRDGQKIIEIISDAKCSKTFAGFVKKFLENNHQVQQRAFRERLERDLAGQEGRPGMPRRRSSWG
ncbi:hypothetical protein MBLNU457_5796t1 [Dothideomycetes sp. NU457]